VVPEKVGGSVKEEGEGCRLSIRVDAFYFFDLDSLDRPHSLFYSTHTCDLFSMADTRRANLPTYHRLSTSEGRNIRPQTSQSRLVDLPRSKFDYRGSSSLAS